MRRREFIALFGGAAAWPIAARAQQPERMPRIGVFSGYAKDDPVGQSNLAAFQRGLTELDWIDGRNVRLDYRFRDAVTDADSKRLRADAEDLVRLMPHVILATTNIVSLALKQATNTIPIVFAQVADPVDYGVVPSLSKPGGNITGFSSTEAAIFGKWPELLKDINLGLSQILILTDLTEPTTDKRLRAIEAAATALRVQLIRATVRNALDIERAIDDIKPDTGGLIVMPGLGFVPHREVVIAMAAKQRLPAVYYYRYWVTLGGLMSLGPDFPDLHRRAAGYVDKILKGAMPADLPVQQPTKFELLINLKTAKALNIAVPPSLLARADEVIE